jgi:hypothetical protein
MMMNFGELVDSLPPTICETAQVDISAYLQQPTGSVLVTYREPDAPMLFQISEDAQRIRTHYPEWNEMLCSCVAMLALSHVAPDPGETPVGVLYCRLAERSPELFMYLLREYQAAFPRMSRFSEAVEQEKKGSSPTVYAATSSESALTGSIATPSN